MALVPIGGGGNDLYRHALNQQLMGQAFQSAGQLAGVLQADRQKQALGQLLAGKPGADFGALTREHAPGLDPMLAGPALAITHDAMAKPGLIHTGQLTPQMAQAFMLQGGDPAALAGLMPKPQEQREPIKLGNQIIDPNTYQPLYTAPTEPTVDERRLIAAGYQPGTPEFQQKMLEAVLKPQSATNVEVKVPAQYPAAPQGKHYEGDFATGDVKLVDTPGYTPEISGDAARNLSLTPGILEDLAVARSAIVDQDGKINRTIIAQMAGKVPWTSGRELGGKFEAALDWVASNRTGATATPEQIASYKNAFRPSPLDSDQAIINKMAALEREALAAQQLARQGRGDLPPPPTVPTHTSPAQPTWMDTITGGLVGTLQQGAEAITGAVGSASQAAPAPVAPTPPQAGGKAQLTPQQLQSMSVDEIARYYLGQP